MTLARKMERWAKLKRILNPLEKEIKAEVLELKRSQQHKNVKATFTNGRREFNYQEIAKELEAPEKLVETYTKSSTDWRKVCLALIADEDVMDKHSKPGKPSVSLKLLS